MTVGVGLGRLSAVVAFYDWREGDELAAVFAHPLRSPAPCDLGDLVHDSSGCEFGVSGLAAGAPAAAAKAVSKLLRSRNRRNVPRCPFLQPCTWPPPIIPTVSRLPWALCLSRCRSLCSPPEPVAAVSSYLPLPSRPVLAATQPPLAKPSPQRE